MGLFDIFKQKNSSKPSAETNSNKWNSLQQPQNPTKWDDLQNVPFDPNRRNDAITLQNSLEDADESQNAIMFQNLRQNNPNQLIEGRFDEVIDLNTGQTIRVPHAEAQQNNIINSFQGTGQGNNKPTRQTEQEFYNRLLSGNISEADEQNFIANEVRGPIEVVDENNEIVYDFRLQEKVFSQVISNPATGKVFQEAINDHERYHSAQLVDLLRQYPTPKDFESLGKEIALNAYMRNKDTFEPTKKAVDQLAHIIYGEKYEYQKAFDALRENAETYAVSGSEVPEYNNYPTHQNANMVQDYEIKEKAPLPEYAAVSVSKGDVYATNTHLVVANFDKYSNFLGAAPLPDEQRKVLFESYINRPNEDRVYADREHRVFAVFDGAGGIGNVGGAYASEACAETIDEYVKSGQFDADYNQQYNQILQQFNGNHELYNQTVQQYQQALATAQNPEESQRIQNILNSLNPFAKMADKIQQNVKAKGMGGASTGIIIKISEDNKRLNFLNVGDSRLYLVRGQEIIQISQDEGRGNGISNGFGFDFFAAKQFGSIEIQPGDILKLGSDGMNGDCLAQEPTKEEKRDAIENHSGNLQDYVNQLVKISRKPDDTSIIAIRIPSPNNPEMTFGHSA